MFVIDIDLKEKSIRLLISGNDISGALNYVTELFEREGLGALDGLPKALMGELDAMLSGLTDEHVAGKLRYKDKTLLALVMCCQSWSPVRIVRVLQKIDRLYLPDLLSSAALCRVFAKLCETKHRDEVYKELALDRLLRADVRLFILSAIGVNPLEAAPLLSFWSRFWAWFLLQDLNEQALRLAVQKIRQQQNAVAGKEER